MTPNKYHSRKRMEYDYYSSLEDKSDTEYKQSSSESEMIYKQNQPNSRKNKKRKRRSRGFQWYKDDEIIVLKTLFEFSGKNAICTKSFYDFVKKRLSKEVSMHQLCSKVTRFRKEYLKCQEDEKRVDDPHQKKIFELSKRIWELRQNQNSSPTQHDMDSEEKLIEYLRSMKIDINYMKPSCLENIKKEWEVRMLMSIEFSFSKCKFDTKIRQLMYQMSNARPIAPNN